jgi:hypothetical protein
MRRSVRQGEILFERFQDWMISSIDIISSKFGARSVVCPTLLYVSSEAVIPAKAGIQFKNTGFPRVKHGAGLVKPGMTIKVKELLTQYSSLEFGVFIYNDF